MRRYHRKYYRPENMCIVISGHWEEEQEDKILSIVSDIESQALNYTSSRHLPPYERPWTSMEGMDTSHIDNKQPVTSSTPFHS